MPPLPRCFVPGCKTGYPSDRNRRKAKGEKYPSLFCVQRDEEMLEKWKKAISQPGKEFKWTDSVCEKHFHEDDIDRHYIKRFPDGTCHVLERKMAKLKPWAVPAIFLNCPGYKSFPKEITQPAIHYLAGTKKKEVVGQLDFPSSTAPSSGEFHSVDYGLAINSPSNDITIQEVVAQLDSSASKAPSSGEVCSVDNGHFISSPSSISIQQVVAQLDSPAYKAPSSVEFHSVDSGLSVSSPSNDIILQEVVSRLYSPASKAPPSGEFHSVASGLSISSPSNDIIMQEEEPSCDSTDPVQSIREESYLSDTIKSVTLPSHLWTIHATSNNYVVCARWNEQCLAERRVVIMDDLSIIVFVHNVKLQKQYEKITSVSDLSLLLREVDKYVACKAINKYTKICEGIVTPKRFHAILCNKCRRESRRHHYETSKSKYPFKKKSWYQRIVTERRAYAFLKEEVAVIKRQIEYEKSINKELSKLDETIV